MRTLPAPTRDSGARLPTVSRRRSVLPKPSHRLLTPRDVPPLPTLRVVVAADMVVVVRSAAETRVTARVTAALVVDVVGSASARADGGRKEADADLAIVVSSAATAVARYRRTALSEVTVSTAAHAAAHARADLAVAVAAAGELFIRANVDAVLSVNVTVTAEIVAIGGQIPVDANLDIAVGQQASAVGRIYRDASLAVDVTATAERLIRMAASAVQSIAVSSAATVKVPVKADLGVTVSATADARLAFDNSGLTKNDTQEVASGTTAAPAWTVVAPWVVRSGFATTIIEDNGIRVPAGVTVNITYRVPFSSQPGPSAYTYSRLTNDGVEIPNSVVSNSGYSDAAALTLTGLVGTGGIVRVEAYGNSSTARRTVTAAAYIEIMRA
ncbi:hypothetical protein DK926_18995 [Rhodococcus sp. Eu-32]|uniref:hypothetical protein n=1 Tax=Rhodococcus sp. Eu-32 TaxID=1017319 RepID=UPI000DF1E608|nr:hypothetical protein [Rhodococcus sp. Eu-32]RRQ26330.1 hypothetical protein DK926_18995 [Rhodococcus sp. Eu-32]